MNMTRATNDRGLDETLLRQRETSPFCATHFIPARHLRIGVPERGLHLSRGRTFIRRELGVQVSQIVKAKTCNSSQAA